MINSFKTQQSKQIIILKKIPFEYIEDMCKFTSPIRRYCFKSNEENIW